MRSARLLALALVLGSLAGCNCALQVRYDGLRCDPGNSCPQGFACVRETTLDVCRAVDAGSTCAANSCDTPPASQCQDANTRRSFTGGTCDPASGQCVWTTQDQNCPQGCAGGLCTGDPCNGVSCGTPPAPQCVSNNTALRTFQNPGSCSGGVCSYAQTDVPCANGCANNQCVNQNLCAGITCNTPPQPACSGSNLITYGNGTCNSGTGICSYAQNITTCPQGCANGRCNSAQLNFLWTQPQVRHQVTALDQAPASSGLRVLAVGPGGAISVFNGNTWSRLTSNTTQPLNAVWFCSAGTALVVGENRTVLRYSVASNALSPVANVPTTNLGASLVGLHGMSCDDYILVDGSGGWARWRLGAWTSGTLSSGSSPYRMRSVYVAADQKTRIAGLCYAGTATQKGCVAYNNPLGTTPNTWFEDQDNSATSTEGFMSVGPPVALSADAWVGTFPTARLKRHDAATGAIATDGGVPDLGTQPAFANSSGVLAISGTGGAAGRNTFLLTGGNANVPGYLWRANSTGLEPASSLDLYFNVQSMGRTESGGVMVADARTMLGTGQANSPVVNDIFRRGVTTYDAYDLAEDWVGLDVGTFPVGTGGTNVSGLVLVSAYNDVAVRGGAMTRWYFQRGPFAQVTDVVAGNQFAFIVAKGGDAYRFTAANLFQKVTTSTTQDLSAVCRVTDSQMYAVGNAGVVLSYTGGTTATPATSPTTKNLFDVHCPTANAGVACGQDGTVLRMNAGTWSVVSPAFPQAAAQLTSCRVDTSTGALFVAGNNTFYRFQGGAWTSLPSRSALSDLVVRAVDDVYAASGSEIAWFNGSTWSTAFTAAQPLWAGGQLGARVVYTGVSGVLVESQ